MRLRLPQRQLLSAASCQISAFNFQLSKKIASTSLATLAAGMIYKNHPLLLNIQTGLQ
jgi:hypothetical protein